MIFYYSMLSCFSLLLCARLLEFLIVLTLGWRVLLYELGGICSSESKMETSSSEWS